MTTTNQFSKTLFVAARFILGGMYLGAGIENLMQIDSRVEYAAYKGVTNPYFWVTAASLLLVFAGASFITGFRPYLGVAAIVLFLVPVTLIMHNFWALQGVEAELEKHTFMGNVGLFGGGLLLLAIPQPWAMSLDGFLASSVAGRRARSERVAQHADPVESAQGVK
jgi:putative oxidoreductase